MFTLISFVALGRQSEEKVQKNGRQRSITTVAFGQRLLRKEQCDNTGPSHYYPDLAAAEFYLFPALKERRFFILLTSLRMRWQS